MLEKSELLAANTISCSCAKKQADVDKKAQLDSKILIREIGLLTGSAVLYHQNKEQWLLTPLGDKRGYIQPQNLHELWVHTGTLCNLSCPFCFEGSSNNSSRIELISFDEAKSFLSEALTLGVKQFSFTGGEPFMNKDFIKIIDFALDHNPCLILTNATKPLGAQLDKIASLIDKKHMLSFRISIDSPNKEEHEKNRGKGNFDLAFENAAKLYKLGFQVSIASHLSPAHNSDEVNAKFKALFKEHGLDENTRIVFFPDLHLPFQSPVVPFITENCMTSYKTAEERDKFMCAHSAMIAKKQGKIHIYPCTLVDDDDDYNMAETIAEALKYRVMLKHHRCFACFSSGTSCSQL